MENMINLFKEPVEVKDLPNAPPILITNSCIEFKNVCFAYDPRKQILKDISFKVPEGIFD